MPDDKSIDEERAVAEIAVRLQERFPDATPQAIAAAIEQARDSLSGAKVKDFVLVLIEKEAKARLKGKR
ncbi:three-helix bundle dimerization domain-containing protein [Microbacterium sp. BWT-B31]|uniref:three-helix bundle dimerization domain-containing protein n=1 Tax=Microbacterium sp. BWT-B31 TaxID=3232072 RepID=UPI003527E090